MDIIVSTEEFEAEFREYAAHSGEVLCPYPHGDLIMGNPCPLCGAAV